MPLTPPWPNSRTSHSAACGMSERYYHGMEYQSMLEE